MRIRTLIGYVLLASVALGGAGDLAAQTPPTVSYYAPATGATVTESLYMGVRVQSTNEIASAVVQVGGLTFNLTPGTYCTGPYYTCWQYPGWVGTLDLTPLARGGHMMVTTVTDVLGNAASATTSIVYDRTPTVQVEAPTAKSVARPQIALKATCVDDDPDGCTSFVALIENPYYINSADRYVTMASGRGVIDTVIDLAPWNGLAKDLLVVGTDSLGREHKVTIPLYVDDSAALQQVGKVEGEILDADATRILYKNDFGALWMRDRASGADTFVFSGLPPDLLAGRLTAAGVAYSFRTTAFPFFNLRSLEGSTVVDLGGLNSQFTVEGRYLVWSNGNQVTRRDVLTGAQTVVASDAGNTDNDVAADGAVAYWTYPGYEVFLREADGTTTALTSDPDSAFWNIYPVTDGDGVVFVKSTPCCDGGQTYRIFLARDGVSTELVPSTSGSYPQRSAYQIDNGWVAFNRAGPSGTSQVWRVDGADVQTQVTFTSSPSFLEKLAADGALLLKRGMRRFLVPAGSTTNIDVGTTFGNGFFIDGVPHVGIYGTLFRVAPPALVPSPTSVYFGTQAAGTTSTSRQVTLTNGGTSAVSVSSVIANAGFTLASNTCGSVAAGGSCTVSVTFAPAARGLATGSLTIDTSAGTQVVPLSGIGQESQAIVFGPAPAVVVSGTGLATATGGGSGNPVVFSSLTPTTCAVSATGVVDGRAAGTCTVAANQAGTSDYAAAVQATLALNITVSPAVETRLMGVSTRAQVLIGDNVMIGGFIIEGDVPKKVVVNARGPSLTAQGVAGAMANPTLTLVPASGPTITNDDWQDAPNAAEIRARGLNPPNPLESSIMATLPPGGYTAIVSGAQGTTGVGIVEVLEADRPDIPLVAISTRGLAGTGDTVVIGGFVVKGSSPQTLVVRARGPSLGVAGALADPVLTVVPPSGPAWTNDDWQSHGNAAQLFMSGFAPTSAKEAAMLLTLNPGAYTAIVSGAGGSTGVAIVEVYALP